MVFDIDAIDNTKYLVRVRATAKTQGIIYSEESTSIYIKIIPNTIRGTLEFVLKKLSDDPIKYDYSKSQVQWAEAQNATNGYKVDINGYEFETDLTTFDLENDDYSITPERKNTVKVLIKGAGSENKSHLSMQLPTINKEDLINLAININETDIVDEDGMNVEFNFVPSDLNNFYFDQSEEDGTQNFSMQVVKISNSPPCLIWNLTFSPSLLPIQFFCCVLTFSI